MESVIVKMEIEKSKNIKLNSEDRSNAMMHSGKTYLSCKMDELQYVQYVYAKCLNTIYSMSLYI